MLRSLSEAERAVLNRQQNGLPRDHRSVAPPTTVFGFASSFDKYVLYGSALGALIAGATNPLISVIYGQLVGSLNAFAAGTASKTELSDTISRFTAYYVYVACSIFLFIYASTVGFYYSGERIARTLRCAYLDAVLRQNMAFFDQLAPGDITNRILTMGTIQEAITSKLSIALTAGATFTAALVISCSMHWKLASLVLPFFLAMLITGTLSGRKAVGHQRAAGAIYSKASGLAQEAIASPKHLNAYGIAGILGDKYLARLRAAGVSDLQGRNTITTFIAWCNAMPCILYATVFWIGSVYLIKGQVTVSEISTASGAGIIGAFSIARVAPSAQALIAGIASAGEVLKTISRRSTQDPASMEGIEPHEIKGDIELKSVSLVYPSRDEVRVLDRVSLKCQAMKKTALVGASGSGKSSIVSLLERFYEPTEGEITLDGTNIAALNLRWLRRNIAIVGQEPVLFNTTIFENIRYGLIHQCDTLSHEDIVDRVMDAAKKAFAHDFILNLPDGYQSNIGEGGARLSGGQRQRIAIARALVKNPAILLLDEATSALDSKSEEIVQKALDAATEHRTTIVIAHRLSTIYNADHIIVMAAGQISEQGTHAQLMAQQGAYAELVNKQNTKAASYDEQARNNNTTDELRPRKVDNRKGSDQKRHDSKNEKLANEKDRVANENDDEDGLIEEGRGMGGRFTFRQTARYIYGLNAPEHRLLTIGLACAVIAGLGIPFQSMMQSRILEALALPKDKYPQLGQDVATFAKGFLFLALYAAVFWLGNGLAFGKSTVALSQRTKDRTFRAIMAQDVSFFDGRNRSIGALNSLLSSSTEDLIGLGGPVLGGFLTFNTTMVAGILIAFSNGWKLALLCTGTVPFVVACGWLRVQMLAVFDGKVRQSGQDSAAFASELVRHARTIASLGLEQSSVEKYNSILGERAEESLPGILKSSAYYAASHSVIYVCIAAAYKYGGVLIARHEYSVYQFYICYTAIIVAAQIAGAIFVFAPDASKAMFAAHDLCMLHASRGSINSKSNDSMNEPVLHEKATGTLELRSVSFAYPSNPFHDVLDNINLSIPPGTFIALVGPSGCGKSTLISLLERFYDPTAGTISFNGENISSMPVARYRAAISLVGQEATLYSGTIRENIALGVSGRRVDDAEIIEACVKANIYSFITSLPDGFSTQVGAGGSMLSGGQKQRLAIAQALLRDPDVLLLDEATSALDLESETLVQAALMSAAANRTTIAVAHRLSTVRHADCIHVLDKGKIVESGRHEDLIARRGVYYDLVNSQMLM